MEMSYRNKGINHYMEVNMGDEKDNRFLKYKINMLEENDILHLIRPVCSVFDNKLYLRYNTDTNYLLSRLLLRMKPDGGFLSLIINQICQCIKEIEKYLLVPDDLIINPDYIFYNWFEKKVLLLCVPGYNVNVRRQLKTFLEDIMKIFDHRDNEGVQYMYNIYEMISDDRYSISDWLKISVNSKMPETPDVICDTSNENTEVQSIVPLTNGSLHTMLISEYPDTIVIGRGKKDTDYRVPTVQISRIHACIYKRDDGIYLEDRDSTNGTYLNNVRIPSMCEKLLAKGDIIGFANEEFFVS